MTRPVELSHHLSPESALAFLEQDPGGAVVLMTMNAKAPGLRVTPTPEARTLLEDAVELARAKGARRAVAWYASGDLAEGMPVSIVGASGESRAVAMAAIDVLVEGLKGVATREDL